MITDIQITRITNLTNGIDLIKTKPDEIIEITQFATEKIGLVLPKIVGKNLLVNLESVLILSGKKEPFNMSGKIIKVESSFDISFFIEIELHHYDHALWDQFLMLRKEVQAKVDHLFYSIKGEE